MIRRLIRSTRMLLVGGTLSLACGVPAHAQDDGTRRGVWLRGHGGPRVRHSSESRVFNRAARSGHLRWRRHAPFSPRSAAGERMDAERAFARRAHNTKPVVEVITRAPRSMVGIVRATIHEPRRSHAAA